MLRGSLCAVVVLSTALACSFSNSSKSSSDSATGASRSSGSSSGESSARFQQDLEVYTAARVTAGQPGDAAFLTGLGDLARGYGISDWEADPRSWEAIGRGLGRAALSGEQRTAWAQAWVAGDAEKQSALDRGYEAAR
jgi:ABC-type Fe3+-hydroxamate transport system substrate-binding protein